MQYNHSIPATFYWKYKGFSSIANLTYVLHSFWSGETKKVKYGKFLVQKMKKLKSRAVNGLCMHTSIAIVIEVTQQKS